MNLTNMMLAWPGSEREPSDDFVFVMTIRLIEQIKYLKEKHVEDIVVILTIYTALKLTHGKA